MATYNGELYIEEQLNSIIAQTYTEWKLWIHDDGSTDNTVAILQDYQQVYPDKIVIIESDNKHLGAKKNYAYLYEHVPIADYYAFCDQDDIWSQDKLDVLMSFAEESDQTRPALIYHDINILL